MSRLERNQHINVATSGAHLSHFGYFNHQNFVLGYLAQALLQELSLHQRAWKQVGWDRHVYMYPVGRFQGEWQHVNSIN